MNDRNEPGARANQGFGAPGGKAEQRTGQDSNAPAPKDDDMARQTKDGLDPQAMKKRIESEGEIIAEEQLREDLAVTGAPPKKDRPAKPNA